MEKPEFHIMVCNSFRAGADAKGFCKKKGAEQFLPYIENEILDRGLDAQVTACGCLKVCERGPAVVVYPGGQWYGEVDSEEKIDLILDAIEESETVEELAIA